MSLSSTDNSLGNGAFVPPYPPRLPAPPSTLQRLLIARRDFLEMWEDEAFDLEFSHSRMFLRQTFLCNSPESVQFAFSQKNASFQRKSPQMRYALAPLLGDGLFISDGRTWKTRRKMVAPIIHISRIKEFAPVMVDAATETRERWAASEGSTIDILADSARLTAEIICRTLFGRKLGDGYAGQIVQGFSNYQRAIDQIDIISFLGLPDWFPRWHGRRVRHNVKQIHAVLDEVVASARASAGNGEPSVINHLFEARDENGAPLDSEALRNEIGVLFMAGHETTANTLAWTWYLLSQAPEVEAKLHAELDSVLGDRVPTLDDVPQLVYTRAILDEALRLYPPVPDPAARSDKGRRIQRHAHPERLAALRRALAATPAPQAVGVAGSLHPGTLPAGKRRQDFQVRLCAVQHRPAHLCGSDIWFDGSHPLPGHPGAEIHAAAEAGLSGQAGLPPDLAARGRVADDRASAHAGQRADR